MAAKQPRGRPPAGAHGEKRSQMRHQVTARVPDADYRLLRALSATLQTSQAEVIARALAALTNTLSTDEQNIVRLMQRKTHR